MTQLILPRRFTQQPQQAVQVDRSNPLAAGIVSLAAPPTGDVARGKVASLSGNATLATSPQGRVWQGASANCPVDIGVTGGITSLIASTSSWTWYGRIFVSVLGVRQIFIGDYDAAGSNETFGFEIKADNTWLFHTVNTAPIIIDMVGGAVTLGWHDLFVNLAASGSGYDLAAYVDGALVGTVNSTSPLRTLGSALRLMNAGTYTGGVSFQGSMAVSAFWSRVASPAERSAVSANPWQLLKAPSRRIWIPVSTGLPGAYTLTADSASFSLTGQSTGLKADRRLSAQTATFGLTGNNAGLKADRRLSATTASFAVTGIDAALTYSPLAKTLTANVGSFVLTGNATALRADRRLSAVVGSYALTAQAANLRAARHISAQTASYAITGNTAGLGAARRLMADAAGYTITGIDVGLTKSNQRTLSAATASFAVTGIAATLKADRRLLAQTGQIVLTANPAGMARGYRLAATTGAYALTGQAVAFRRAYRLAAITAPFAIAGNAVNLIYSPNFDGVLAFSPGSMLSYQRRITKVDGQPRIRSIQ